MLPHSNPIAPSSPSPSASSPAPLFAMRLASASALALASDLKPRHLSNLGCDHTVGRVMQRTYTWHRHRHAERRGRGGLGRRARWDSSAAAQVEHGPAMPHMDCMLSSGRHLSLPCLDSQALSTSSFITFATVVCHKQRERTNPVENGEARRARKSF